MQTATRRQSGQVIELPLTENFSPEQVAQKSLIHWGWTPYKDIINVAPWGIYSQLGYREQRWGIMQRCVPYPFGNIVSTEVDRAAVAETHASGFSVDYNSATAPKITNTKYAQTQVAELGDLYRDEGFRVLLPLIGMDDPVMVGTIFKAVQPVAYLVHEMEREFSEGYKERLEGMSKDYARIADQLAVIMLGGARAAMTKVAAEYENLITMMSNAQIGEVPKMSNPTPFYEWICLNYNKPIPKRVDKMTNEPAASGVDSAMFKALLERDQERARELEQLREQVNGQQAANVSST
jgi:hypothetical protein